MRRVLTATLLGLTAASAMAAGDATDNQGWNTGLSAVFGQYTWDDDAVDDSSTGLKAFAGYRFNRWFGLEGTYWNFGDFEEDFAPMVPGGEADVGVDGLGLSGVFYLPWFGDQVDLFAKLGYYDFDQELVTDDVVVDTNEPDGFTGGLGFRSMITRNLAFRGDADWFDVSDPGADLWAISVGIEYLFGQAAAPAAAPPPPPPPPAPAAAAPPPPPPPPPADSDGDGVVDNQDQCPDTPRGDRVSAQGCSCDVTRQLRFAFDSAELTDGDRAILDEVAESLVRLKFVSGTVEGHTDSVGNDDYNQALSLRRAQAAADYLTAKGIGGGRLDVEGYGESRPVADNSTDEGRAQNRRVVLRRTDCDAPAN